MVGQGNIARMDLRVENEQILFGEEKDVFHLPQPLYQLRIASNDIVSKGKCTFRLYSLIGFILL